MEKTRDEYQPTTRKSGSALALVSLVIQLDRATCERARPTSHEVSSMPSILFRVFSAERPREKKAMYETHVPTVDSGRYARGSEA